MYINSIDIYNIGPIDTFNNKFCFNEDNTPLPTVVIGDNGKGKTILSSYITDVLFELAKKSYTNVVNNEGAYYRIVGKTNVRNNENFGVAIIELEDNDKKFEYVEKSGEVDISDKKFETYVPEVKRLLQQKDNIKEFSRVPNDNYFIENIFNTNVLASFASYRSEKPSWMNKNSIDYNDIYSSTENIKGILRKEILIEHSEEANLEWLKDVFMDSMIEIKIKDGKIDEIEGLRHQQILRKAKENVEIVLKKILRDENARFIINHRDSRDRFSILTGKGIIPSLKHLSLGQAVLFNMFISIIRHADVGNINNSINLNDIKGIVVIDEIDLHLDSEMQHDVLPRLIKLFPKVQFIITTHSPLFLLGMDNIFKDKYKLIEMPDGKPITTERFSEFQNSYEYLMKTEQYERDIEEKISKIAYDSDKTLIITEGKTDWKHLEKAYKELKLDLNIEFNKLEESMGDGELVKYAKMLPKIAKMRKIILISDNDSDNSKQLGSGQEGIKDWGNNVFSFSLPVPESRRETPKISIEHYYSDEIIKKEALCSDGIKRRLFMSNEFTADGDYINYKAEMMFKCNKRNSNNPIEIYDGSSKCKVTIFGEVNGKNYALSKEDFFQLVIDNAGNVIDYTNFKLIFNKIKEIIDNY